MSSGAMHFLETIREAGISGVLESWKDGRPEMGVLALVAEADREEGVRTLQDVCGRMHVPLRGAVFPALVCRDCFQKRGVVLLRLDVMPFAEIYGPLAPAHRSTGQTIERMTRDIAERIDRPRAGSLFLIFDAMVVNIATILEELYLKLADRVRYMGVNAGSETFRPMPCLFDNERTAQDGALVMHLPDHPGAVVEHCYRAPERLITATSTEGSRVITIDWRPAFEMYRETVKAEYDVEINAENFYQYAVHFPFGIVRAGGEIVVRIPVALQDDGSLFCVGEVPPNALLTLLRAPEVDSIQTVEMLTRGLATLHGTVSGAELLTFYCAGRRIHLGDQAPHELVELSRRTDAAGIAGALSLGEIGHSLQWGYPLFHNGALLCCRWGRK